MLHIVNRLATYLAGMKEPEPHHVDFSRTAFLARLHSLEQLIPSTDTDLRLFARLFVEDSKKHNYRTAPSSFVWGIEALASTLRAAPSQFGKEYQTLTGKHWFEYEALCNKLLDVITQQVIPEGTLTALETRRGRIGLNIRTKQWHFDFTKLVREYRANQPIQIEHGLAAG